MAEQAAGAFAADRVGSTVQAIDVAPTHTGLILPRWLARVRPRNGNNGQSEAVQSFGSSPQPRHSVHISRIASIRPHLSALSPPSRVRTVWDV